MPLPSLPVLPPNGQQGPQSASTPAPIHVARYARNGLLPHAVYETELGNSLAFAARIRRKNLFSWFAPIDDIPSAIAGTRTRWRFAAHTGPLLGKIKAMIYMARQDHTAGGNPSVTLTITSLDGSTTYGSGTASFGASNSGSADAPTDFGTREITITGVPADTDIAGHLEDGYGRLIACTIYEEGLPIWNGNGYPQSQVAVTSPIEDKRRGDMLQLATTLWKHGAAHLWNWTADDQSSPVTVTNDGKNIIDGAAVIVGASRVGATLDLRYCRTRSKTAVPCVLAAYAKVGGAGEDGSILLVDEGANTVATIDVSGETTPGWFTTTVDLPATLARYFLFAASNTGTVSVGAVSLYQYAS